MSFKIALIGEAYGAEEERAKSPFVGPAGYQLNSLLDEAGIRRADCFISNVFNLKPVNNDIETLCVSKREDTLGLPPLRPAKYLAPQYLPELQRLERELREVSPNIVVALGNTAAWALLRNAGISKIRGAVTTSTLVPRLKVLPTYHPAAILRQWDLRPVTVLDLMKAKRESEFKEIRRPERTVYIEPSLSDLDWFFETHIRQASRLAPDIETAGNQITCIGFATSISRAIVVPFVDYRKEGNSYWSSLGEELQAWEWVRKVLALPTPKVFQNGLYDMAFLWRHYGIPTFNADEDSMLLHHALQPESLKGLGFLGSVYTNEASWKLMNSRSKTIKREN